MIGSGASLRSGRPLGFARRPVLAELSAERQPPALKPRIAKQMVLGPFANGPTTKQIREQIQNDNKRFSKEAVRLRQNPASTILPMARPVLRSAIARMRLAASMRP
jgi:hypothetical protein